MKFLDQCGREIEPGDSIVFIELAVRDYEFVSFDDSRLSVAPGQMPTVKIHLQQNLHVQLPNQGQAVTVLSAYLVKKKGETPQA